MTLHVESIFSWMAAGLAIYSSEKTERGVTKTTPILQPDRVRASLFLPFLLACSFSFSSPLHFSLEPSQLCRFLR